MKLMNTFSFFNCLNLVVFKLLFYSKTFQIIGPALKQPMISLWLFQSIWLRLQIWFLHITFNLKNIGLKNFVN